MESSRRKKLLQILRKAGVYSLGESGLDQEYVSGKTNLKTSDLEIDSLSSMQICIELESQCGVFLAPNDLLSFEFLDDIAKLLPVDS